MLCWLLLYKDDEVYLPLYEAKLMHQFDHRFATYTDTDDTRNMTTQEHQNPNTLPLPRYWVKQAEVEERLVRQDKQGHIEWAWEKEWLLGFRDITNSTNERTAIFSPLPLTGVGNNLPLCFIETTAELSAAVFANTTSFVFDYPTRQKIAGTHMNFFFVKQLSIIPPDAYTANDLAFITPRVLELSCTAWDMQPFARDLGWDGAPFAWDEGRRFWLRAELDALYFHLYGVARDDVDYIMDTFNIVKKHDLEQHGTYRTKDMILEIYDDMAQAKAEGREYQTRLDPPPAHPSLAHDPSTKPAWVDEA